MMRIGIDLGGTKIEIIALDGSNKDIRCAREIYRKRIATPQGDYSATLAAIVSLVETLEQELGQRAESIGMGIPGAISATTGLVKNANSVCLIGKPLQADLQQHLKRSVQISNDANCMTLSEATDGAARDADLVFGVIIGTGTGGGISIHKQVIAGSHLIAGEWGHNPLPWRIEEDGPVLDCYCGKQDCIETFLSGPGLLKRYHLMGGKAENVQQIVAQRQLGNPLAEKALDAHASQMARALASIINILDPDCIVLAGGLSHIQSLYQQVPRLWQNYVFSDTIHTPLRQALHGDASGVRGAAWLN